MKPRLVTRAAMVAFFLVAVGCAEKPKVIPPKGDVELPGGTATGGGKVKQPSGKLD